MRLSRQLHRSAVEINEGDVQEKQTRGRWQLIKV